jgi:hypothetical protein
LFCASTAGDMATIASENIVEAMSLFMTFLLCWSWHTNKERVELFPGFQICNARVRNVLHVWHIKDTHQPDGQHDQDREVGS